MANKATIDELVSRARAHVQGREEEQRRRQAEEQRQAMVNAREEFETAYLTTFEEDTIHALAFRVEVEQDGENRYGVPRYQGCAYFTAGGQEYKLTLVGSSVWDVEALRTYEHKTLSGPFPEDELLIWLGDQLERAEAQPQPLVYGKDVLHVQVACRTCGHEFAPDEQVYESTRGEGGGYECFNCWIPF